MASRRPLTQRGLPTRGRGDATLLGHLEAAWSAADADPDELTHGFHSYPARMHPLLARRCLEITTGTILDPFCGSGTVLIEAMIANRRSAGVDLNPIGLRLAEVKSALRHEAGRESFAALVRDIAERSEARVRARVPVHAPLSRQETAWYGGHTLKELAGLREEILTTEDRRERRCLEMVFSSLVVKFSMQRADTAERMVEKRIRKGLPTEFFVRRGLELVDRWAALDDATPPSAPLPEMYLGDARELKEVLPVGLTANLILTSPPYGGTYDYIDHHARRYPWLGMEPVQLAKNEIGARRSSHGAGAAKAWDKELGQALTAMKSVLHREGIVVLLIGDGLLEGKPVPADEQLMRIAPRHGLEVRAIASQERHDWQGGDYRYEHLVALVPSPRSR
ncbi:MAG: hypothetical protein ACI9KE_000766 [Polyangiales bacterium]|jgi:hypothetical protein